MVSGILAAWSGAGSHTGVWSTQVHRGVAVACLGINLLAFVAEWLQLRANSSMIHELQAKLDAEGAQALEAPAAQEV